METAAIFDQILAMRSDMQRALEQPDEIQMSPLAYCALKAQTEVSQVSYPDTALPPTVFGMRVVLDPELKPGEWKLVSPNDRKYRR